MGSLSLAECLVLLEQGRPAVLNALKEAGIVRIPDRQKVAKALANAKRDIEGTGLPLLVCMYSAGLNPKQGRDQMKPWLEAATNKGFLEHLVLDHHVEPQYQQLTKWSEYIDALYAQLKTEEYRRRPIILFAHSHGTVGAYGLARRLGPRVRHLVVVARRAPTMELINDVWGVKTAAEITKMDAPTLLEGLVDAYQSNFLKNFVKVAEENWPPFIKATVEGVRALYGSRLSLCAEEDIEEALKDGPKQIASPIMCIAADGEMAQAETAEKAQGWAPLTSGEFSFSTLSADHMGIMEKEALYKLVLEKLTAYLD